MHVHYREVLSVQGTKKNVQCSELGGVHYIEVFITGGFTVLTPSLTMSDLYNYQRPL